MGDPARVGLVAVWREAPPTGGGWEGQRGRLVSSLAPPEARKRSRQGADSPHLHPLPIGWGEEIEMAPGMAERWGQKNLVGIIFWAARAPAKSDNAQKPRKQRARMAFRRPNPAGEKSDVNPTVE